MPEPWHKDNEFRPGGCIKMVTDTAFRRLDIYGNVLKDGFLRLVFPFCFHSGLCHHLSDGGGR